jgi:beta-lactam-binding protein with PASTA domain/tRNA A-37 threonylcarbamoyl transferase component Bud32
MPLISDSIGRVLGKRYRLVSALGSGASAHVYLAEDVTLQRHVAVKVLQPALAKDEVFLKRFGAEARSVASLNHPHVLRVFDWGEDADGPYLVLEYLGGGSLRDLLDRGVRLSHAQAANLGVQAAEGLAYAHVRGLVHRDVKPANLLFDEEGRVRIADFGVARALAEAAWTEPIGAMIGTARYASPEQAEGKSLDGRADVYSLALVLYEAVTGVVPFVTDTTMGTLMARVGRPLPRHDALGPLDEILARAAAPEPGARLDAAQMAARLSSLASSLPPPAPLALGNGVEVAPRRPGGFLAPGVADLTDVAGPSAQTIVRPATPIPDATVVLAGAESDGTGAAIPDWSPAVRTEHKRRRRRWPAVLGAALLVLGVVGLVLGLNSAGVFTPTHQVPTFTNLTLAQARQAAASDHFSLAVGTPITSLTVPAGEIVSQSPGPGSSLSQGSTVHVVLSAGRPIETIPSLLGVNCSTAQRLLSEAHLVGVCPPQAQGYSSSIPVGNVINWSYANKLDATKAPYGLTVDIATSKGPPPVTLANYAGDTYQQVASALQALGLQATQTQAFSTTVPAGEVIGTTPAAGQAAPYGSTVSVSVSQGPPIVTVPSIAGLKVAAAQAALQGAGLTLGSVYGPPNGRVFTSVPLAGQTAPQGSAVNVYTQ